MAIDHLLYNKLKWFNIPENGGSVSAYGKNYWAIPRQVKIPAGTTVYGAKFHISSGVMSNGTTDEIQLLNGVTAECVGTDADYYYIYDNQDEILAVGDVKQMHYECWGYVKKSDVTPVWGG